MSNKIASVCADAVRAASKADMVVCSKDEYESGVRRALQQAAGKWIDRGDAVRAQIALEEVKRLDTRFLFGMDE